MRIYLLKITTFFLFILFQDNKVYSQENLVFSSCDSTTNFFQKTIDLTFEEDVPYDVVTTTDGGKIIVGNTGGGLDVSGNTNYAGEGFILKLNKLGKVEWAKSIGSKTNEPYPFTSDSDEVIYHIVPTKDGNYLTAGIILRGTFAPSNVQHGIFFTKISNEGEILWTKALKGGIYSHINKLLPIPNDEFIFITSLFRGNREVQLIKINGEGKILYKKLLTISDPELTFEGLNVTSIDGENLIVSGAIIGLNLNSQNEVYRKGILIKLNKNGIPVHNKVIEAKEVSKGLQITFGEKTNKNSFVFQGDFTGETLEPNFQENFLIKIDSNLNIVQKKSWQTTDQRYAHSYIPFKTQGSEILMALESWRRFGAIQAEVDAFYLIKLDTNFNVKWNRGYGTAGNETLFDIELSQDRSQILMTGYSNGFNSEGGGLYLINTDQQGLADSCNLIPFEWNEVPFPDLVFDSVELVVDTFGVVVDFDMPIRDITPVVEDICPPPLLPDAIIANLREMENCPSSTRVIVDICNVGENILSENIPISVYNGNPTQEVVDLLLTTSLSRSLSVDDCQQMILNVPFGAENLFVVLNDSGVVNLPYHLGSSFPQSDIRECTFMNNFDSVFLSPYVLQPINLGDDRILCEGEGVSFELLEEYQTIRWHDGSTGNTYFTDSNEIISVTATDFCGVVFHDTVSVTIAPTYWTELDTLIPKGGTFLGIQYFTDTTFTQGLTSIDGCDSIILTHLMVDVSSILEKHINNQVLLFPNPTTGNVNLNFQETTKEDLRLLLFDALSKKVQEVRILKGTKSKTLDFSNFSKGVYFFKLKYFYGNRYFKTGKLLLVN